MTEHTYAFFDPPGCPLFDMIAQHLKTIEGRKNSPKYQKIKPNDILILENGDCVIRCRATKVHKHRDVRAYLEGHGLHAIFGNLELCNIKDIDDGIKLYEKFVPPSEIDNLCKEYGHGFLGIAIVPI